MFFGLFRKLHISLPTIRKHIFTELEKQGISYDIYVHSYKLNHLYNLRSKENAIYDNTQHTLFKHKSLKIKLENQFEVDKTLRFETFLKKENPWKDDPTKNSMKNMLRQQHSIHQVYNMVEQSNINYDGYLFLRPDMVYLNNLYIKHLFPLKNNVVYIPNEYHYDGTNDRLCFTSKNCAKIYASRICHIYDSPIIHSEKYLRYILQTNNIKQLPLALSALRVRSDGTIVKG